jgi:hypothetical protein
MTLPSWNDPASRRRIVGALATLLVLGLATHPELRLLVPLLDAAGVDVLMTLLGLQALSFFSDSLKPWLLAGWQRAGALLSTGSGPLGLVAWVALLRAWHAMRTAALPRMA